MFGLFALVVASLFTGAAVYIIWAEQPARLAIDDRALLAQWKLSYARGFALQAALAVIGFILGALEWIVTGNWLWLAGGVILVANWPYTMCFIMPTNHQLNAIAADRAGPQSRALIETWGSLHAVRALLGAVAMAVFLWNSL